MRSKNKQLRLDRERAARAIGTHTREEWLEMRAFFNETCVRCGKNDLPVERDHIVPLYQGGSDSIRNVQPFCARCNSMKGPDRSDYRGSSCPEKWRTSEINIQA